MTKAIKKFLWVILLATLLILPIMGLAGCDAKKDAYNTKDEIVEINNVERIKALDISLTYSGGIEPYQHKVWINTKTGRIYFYSQPTYTDVWVDENSVLKYKKYDLPYDEYYLEFEYEPAKE